MYAVGRRNWEYHYNWNIVNYNWKRHISMHIAIKNILCWHIKLKLYPIFAQINWFHHENVQNCYTCWVSFDTSSEKWFCENESIFQTSKNSKIILRIRRILFSRHRTVDVESQSTLYKLYRQFLCHTRLCSQGCVRRLC